MARSQARQRSLDFGDDLLEMRDKVEEERQLVLRLFPLRDWPSLPISQYAMGVDNPDAYCRVMEFRTHRLGRIGGGSASKHIIYRGRDGVWHVPQRLQEVNVNDAWEELREQFVEAFDAAQKDDLDTLDSLPLLRHGQTLVMKSLAVYFPGQFLPVYSGEHLRHFISHLGAEPIRNATRWRLNRQLLELQQKDTLYSSTRPHEFARALYANLDPRDPGFEAIMIAPGRGASLCMNA